MCWWQMAWTRLHREISRGRQGFGWTPAAQWTAPAPRFRWPFVLCVAIGAGNSSKSAGGTSPNWLHLVAARRIFSANAFHFHPFYVCQRRKALPEIRDVRSRRTVGWRGTCTMWMAVNLLRPHNRRSLFHILKAKRGKTLSAKRPNWNWWQNQKLARSRLWLRTSGLHENGGCSAIPWNVQLL